MRQGEPFDITRTMWHRAWSLSEGGTCYSTRLLALPAIQSPCLHPSIFTLCPAELADFTTTRGRRDANLTVALARAQTEMEVLAHDEGL